MTKKELLEFVNSLDEEGNYHGRIYEDVLVKEVKTKQLPIIEDNEIVGYTPKNYTKFKVVEELLLDINSGEYSIDI